MCLPTRKSEKQSKACEITEKSAPHIKGIFLTDCPSLSSVFKAAIDSLNALITHSHLQTNCHQLYCRAVSFHHSIAYCTCVSKTRIYNKKHF